MRTAPNLSIHPLALLGMALLALLVLSAHGATAATFEDRFAVVFIDAGTEARHGAFPLDRNLIAEALERLADAKAKGVVLKFFYDQPKDLKTDARLAAAIGRLPVILQARMDQSETKPNPLPERFTFPALQAKTVIAADRGWIPLPLFSANAHSIGFIDFSGPAVPMLEKYQGNAVKSLILCSLELELGQPARIEPGRSLRIQDRTWKLDERNQIITTLPQIDSLAYIPFHHVLARTVPDSAVAGKVVIIGYDGPKIHAFDTPLGKMKAHRMFVYALKSAYAQGSPDVGRERK